MRVFSGLCAASLAFAPAMFARAEISVDAGPDQTVDFPGPVVLQAVVTGLSPLDYWVADGDDQYENMIMKYHSVNGLTQSGPLRDWDQAISYPWPSDMVRINETVFGIDTFRRCLWVLNDDVAGDVTQIGPISGWQRLSCLAYDSNNDILYAGDFAADRLLRVNRQTGQFTPVMTLPFGDIRGLAFDPQSGLLYASDITDHNLYSINPATHEVSMLWHLPSPPDSGYDELDFYRGKFYGAWQADYLATPLITQLRHIDLATGAETDIGPPIVESASHSLMINAMPEEMLWTMAAGPGSVTFSSPNTESSEATFSMPGIYALELTVFSESGSVSDIVIVHVIEFSDCNGNGISDAMDIADGASRDCDADGVPDECGADWINVELFVATMLAPSPGPALICLYDQNADGVIDGDDVQGFLARL